MLVRLLTAIKPWLIWLALSGLLMVLREGTQIAVFDIVGRMVDLAVHQSTSNLFRLLVLSIALILINSAIWGYSHFASELVVASSLYQLSKMVVSRIIDLPLKFLEKQKTGDLISRLNNDINKIDEFLGYHGRAMYEGLLKYLIAAAYMLVVNWQLAIICVIMGPLVMLSIRRLTVELRKLSKASNEMHGRETAFVSDTIQGIREVKSFNLIPRSERKYGNIVRDLLSFLRSLVFKEHLIMGICDMMFFIPEIVIMGLGGYLVLRGEISVGQVLAFRFVYTAVRGGIDGFIKSIPRYKEATTTGHRVFEIIDKPTEEELHARDSDAGTNVDQEAMLQFNQVSFRYQSMPDSESEMPENGTKTNTPFALNNVSFSVMPGETVALVGPSGSGKSTVLKLIAGLYEPLSGIILIKGQKTTSLRLEAFRRYLGLVSQDPFLFPVTIHNNIAYGRGSGIKESDGTRIDVPIDSEIIEAARSAEVHEFASKLSRGYESLVGERGVKLSGGQMQRVAIARAILKQPELLLLDEPTSALDVEAEHRVQRALSRLMQDKSSIITAHRLSSIKHAARILVLDKGEIVERGSHEQLMDKKGLYFDLYRLQAKGTPE